MCRDVRESDRDRAFKVCILDPVLKERGEKIEKRSQRSDERGLGRNQGTSWSILLWLEEKNKHGLTRLSFSLWSQTSKKCMELSDILLLSLQWSHLIHCNEEYFTPFSSLIKPSTLPPSLHSWPVIYFPWRMWANPERTASSSLPPHLCTVQTLVWLLWLSLSAVAVPKPRPFPPRVMLSSSLLGSAPRLFFPFLLHHCFLLLLDAVCQHILKFLLLSKLFLELPLPSSFCLLSLFL